MTQLPEETLAYERNIIGSAIRRLQALMTNLPAQSKSLDFYSVMEQCFIALEQSMERFDQMETTLIALAKRIQMLETIKTIETRLEAALSLSSSHAGLDVSLNPVAPIDDCHSLTAE